MCIRDRFYGGVWWSWVFPDAIFGILVGLFAKSFEIKAGGFNKKKVLLLNVCLLYTSIERSLEQSDKNVIKVSNDTDTIIHNNGYAMESDYFETVSYTHLNAAW